MTGTSWNGPSRIFPDTCPVWRAFPWCLWAFLNTGKAYIPLSLCLLYTSMRRMTELADAGFISAYTTIFDTLFARAETANSKVPLEQLEYWAGRAAKAGHINGHFYLGLVYETPEYLQRDYETYMAKSLQEYLLAMEMENENAPQRLERLWNHEFTSSQYSAEESRQAQAFFREQMKAWLEPELKRLREQDDEEACCAFGQMYLCLLYTSRCV